MPSPYVGEVRIFAGDYAPAGWAVCDGTELPVADNAELFALVGTTYGGDGVDTFKLPDLRARAALHAGQGPGTSSYAMGATGGVEQVAVTTGQLPAHSHGLAVSTSGGTGNDAEGNVLAESSINLFIAEAPTSLMASTAVVPIGSSNGHENRMPFIALNYIVAVAEQQPADTQPLVGEVRAVSFDDAPAGWTRCSGQEIPVEQNPVLFAVIGSIYGGDGVSTFALPNIEGSVVVGCGQGDGLSEYFQGDTGGVASVAIAADEMPTHTHRVRASIRGGDLQAPGPSRALARSSGGFAYQTNVSSSLTAMSPEALQTTGASAPHNNLPPILVLNHLIALDGQVPSR